MSYSTPWWFQQPWKFVNKELNEECFTVKAYVIEVSSFYSQNKSNSYTVLLFPFMHRNKELIIKSMHKL